MARIFVSSTFKDLEEYREKVRTVLRRMDHEDTAMEYFDKCLEAVASCDFYVGILLGDMVIRLMDTTNP
jgi:Domain of unknown function (DUF4062)